VRFASAFLLSALFALLAALVAVGAFSGLDQWGVDHLMPGATFEHPETGLAATLVPLWDTRWGNAYSIAANVVTLPASAVIAFLLTLWRSRPLAVVLVLGTAVEALCKHVLARPALYAGAHHLTGFDSSFPSGHTLRAMLVAAAFAPRWSVPWVVASVVLIQLDGWHTPSDILGGLVLGALGLLGARALRARRLARARPAA
jgi:membrane-associated phospholipid phosphatase